MKIQEFRDKMKSADRAALEKIAADLYRRLPKALKEEELDQNIELILKGSDAPCTAKQLSHTCMYPFSPKPHSHLGCHITLNRVPCAL